MQLPTGWEGGITRNPARTRSLAPEPDEGPLAGDEGSRAAIVTREPDLATPPGRGVERGEDGSFVMPVVHLANFPLPSALDVFGTQAVTTMATGDSFVSLVEYGPEEAGTALFSRVGIPRRLSPADFSPKTLNRTLPDQVGVQVFATENGRAFCLYVVLAGRARIGATLRSVNQTLSTLEIAPR